MTHTADLCDTHGDKLHIANPVFRNYGKKAAFEGPITTLQVFEDNSLVRSTLETFGNNRVLVIDGGGSMRCALVGGELAELAANNGWAGIIVNGCIRDAEELKDIDIGVFALATHPQRSQKRNIGESDIPVTFAGITFIPEHFVYADRDGIVVAEGALLV